MASRTKVMKGLGAFVVLNNITTLITRGLIDTPQSEEACLSKYKDFAAIVPYNATNYCNAVFDTYLCWPPTKPATLIQQNCPTVRLSDPTRYASRRCGKDGLWESRRKGETSMRGWTNFTTCFPPDIQGLFVEGFNEDQNYLTKYEIAQNSRYIEITGYSISCVAIIVSLYIFYTFRTLQNIRTLIHKHVFYSILSQTVVCLVIFFDQFITRESIGVKTTNHALKGIDNTPNICEALYFIAEYSMSTIFSWVLVEGLHLNYLISNEALRPFKFRLYCLAAWVVPFFLTSIWAVVVWLSYRWDDVKTCWFGYNLASSYWILQGPRLAVIMCNAVILIRVLKMVIQKLNDARTPEIIKIKKSVKAALFLLPILGLSNMLSTFDTSIHTSIYLFMALSYSRQFLKSFQGLLLSLIYCVGNEEVRTVVMKRIRSIFIFENVNCLAIIRWLLPRRQVFDPILPSSPMDSTTPPNVEETTLSQDMRSSSVTQQPPRPYEIPLAVISGSAGLNFKQNKESFVSETSFTDIALSRHIDSEVEDNGNYESIN